MPSARATSRRRNGGKRTTIISKRAKRARMFVTQIGVWTGNLLVAVGVLLLAVRVYAARRLARIRHVSTGEPIPGPDYVSSRLRDYASMFFKSRQPSRVEPIDMALNEMRQYGPTYVQWRGSSPVVIVTQPEDTRRLLHDKGEMFGTPHGLKQSRLGRVMGASLVSTEGQKWRTQRRAMDPAFKYKKIQTLVPMFAQCCRKLISKWEEQLHQPIKVEEGLTAVTLDAIGMGAFRYDFGAVDGGLGTHLKNYKRILASAFGPSSDDEKFDQAVQDFQAFLQQVLTTHREKDNADSEEPDLLDHIIAMDANGQLTNEEIMHNLFLFFLAGHDTSASSLTSALYFLAKHPNLQEKAYKEVNAVLGEEHNISFSHLSKLEYLSMFLKETLRMRPPVSTIGTAGRMVVADGAVIGGYTIPRGTSVAPSILALHYDERHWSDPHTFNPERFAGKDAGKELWAFSTGPRVCMGKKFAMTEMLTVLALLLQRFEFKLPDDYQWQFRPFSITIRPLDGLPLRVERRPTGFR